MSWEQRDFSRDTTRQHAQAAAAEAGVEHVAHTPAQRVVFSDME